jgi:hypothetical protein
MKIRTRRCTSLDGRVTTTDGLPVQLAFGGWDAGALGYYERQVRCDAVLMGGRHSSPRPPHWPRQRNTGRGQKAHQCCIR